ncbi:MAG: tRNA (guanosine(46)-N7)-methyltransferase TrmB [Rhodocyclaceae bacterium]|jgi:tRNA (guanine-N7-)-methyltransferase|nr:tRNA (guanosine(46)-N7)-methyltransferase TrmB [Rhodocyclaceae bacterium]
MSDTSDATNFGHGPHIRSFVRRLGRLSPGQARAVAQGLPRWGIEHGQSLLHYPEVFGRSAPVIMEIGCGMGETTAHIAAAQSACDFIGIEVHTPGVGSLLKQIDERGLTNLRVIQHDAVAVVSDMIAADSLRGIHVFFPDPWPKKRHHKRRLLQLPFVTELAKRLAPGGYLHCATDWEEYAQQMVEVLGACSLLRNTSASADGFAPRPAYRPQTKFETRGLRLGHGVWDLVFQRI